MIKIANAGIARNAAMVTARLGFGGVVTRGVAAIVTLAGFSPATGAPQLWQNFAVGLKGSPQLEQRPETSTLAPHSGQNFAAVGISAWQLAQFKSSSFFGFREEIAENFLKCIDLLALIVLVVDQHQVTNHARKNLLRCRDR